jgi:MoaA/NifB/PqqE/SkfB family radical SAM enzyme
VDEKNDAVRRGTSLKQVLTAITALGRAKEKLGRASPAVHLAYMLLRSGLQDLERLPNLLQGAGVSQIVVSTLDFVPSRELAGEVVRPAAAGEYEELRSRLQELARLGRRRGMNIHYQLRPPGGRRPSCTENVQQALVVNAEGLVSPCVYTNLPVSGGSCFKEGLEYPYAQLFFGNIKERPLGEIWSQKTYANFRRSFKAGKLAPPCQGCAKL